MSANVSEKDLIDAVVSGNRKAFNQLYSLYMGDLYRYVYLFLRSREESQEIVQDVFVKIWQKREALATVNSFKPYLHRMAKNMVIDEIRKRQVDEKMCMAMRAESEESDVQADQKIIYSQYYQLMINAINLLPEKRRRIVEMRVKEDLSLDEIAERMAISKNVVKKQLYAGLGFVKEHLNKYVEFSGTLVLFFTLFVD